MTNGKEQVKTLFQQKDLAYSSVAQGEHNGVFYFGSSVKNPDGKIKTCVITSDKKLFIGKKSIQNDFDLQYQFPFSWEIIPRRWSNVSIDAWLKGKTEHFSLDQIYTEIFAVEKKFMSYSDERYYSFISVWVIATYFHKLFESFGRILFNAPKSSGKTKQTTILSLICFNAIFSANISSSALFSSVESTGATVLIDDFDNLLSERQTNELLQLIRTGYKSGQKVVRQREKPKVGYTPRGFDFFSPLVINNTKGLDKISSDRCIELNILKTTGNITKLRIDSKSPAWSLLRDKLHICAMLEWKRVKGNYKTLKIEDDRINSRALELFSPFFAIASLISPQVFKNIKSLAIELNSKKDVADIEMDSEYIILKFISNYLPNEVDTVRFTISQIFNGVREEVRPSSDKAFRNYIGALLRRIPRIGIIPLSKGIPQFPINREILEEYAKARDFELPKENWVVESPQ